MTRTSIPTQRVLVPMIAVSRSSQSNTPTEHTLLATTHPNDHDSKHSDSTPSTERAPNVGTRIALDHAVSQLGPDEQRVLTRNAERLALGATTYGPLTLVSDPRFFRSKEAREEVEDALVYLACAWLKGEEVAA